MRIQDHRPPNLYVTDQKTPLTAEQKNQLQEILNQYEPENLSPEDMKKMRKELKAADIPTNREANQIIRNAGFTPAATGRDRMASNSLPDDEGDLITPKLIGLYRQLYTGELTEKEFHTKIQQVKQGYSRSAGNFVNYSS